MLRAIILLAASFGAPAIACAQEAAPFVTQLRLPARDLAIDVVAWRGPAGIEVARADLERLSFELPADAADRVALASIPGLEIEEVEAITAIVLRCVQACLQPQLLAARDDAPVRIDRARGAYVNYDLDLQWVEQRDFAAAGFGQAVAFGGWGLLESSWVASSGDLAHAARLETRWNYDLPEQRLRLRVGDSVALAADGAPVRFAGVQFGSEFALAPHEITYPVAPLGGEADGASTVELYVDGALRAREQVNGGPFVFDAAPLVTGGGEAQLVITDLAGRQQIVTRPFFVSTSLLQPGLSDWSLAVGAERRRFGVANADYGRAFASGRYRRGVNRALTVETGVDIASEESAARLGLVFAHATMGQVHAVHARSAGGGASSFAWLNGRDGWSVGLQAEQRDAAFRSLGRNYHARGSFAGHVSVELGAFGAAALTAATVSFDEGEDARTLTLSFAPPLRDGALSARVIYTEREDSEVAFGLSYAVSLSNDVAAGLGYDADERGATYRASMQRVAEHDGALGWRARAMGGRRQHAEVGVSSHGRHGDSVAQVAYADDVIGARLGHSGSIGMIESRVFAAAPIRGAFALVDVGAPGVRVLRDRFGAGATADDGRRLLTDLRPYDVNHIAINANDLPFDRAPSVTEMRVAPAYGAGVVVRFNDETERLVETRVHIGRAPAPRGALLVRRRDGARFPVGSQGRVVLRGAREGDIVELDLNRRCSAAADETAARDGLVLQCEEAA